VLSFWSSNWYFREVSFRHLDCHLSNKFCPFILYFPNYTPDLEQEFKTYQQILFRSEVLPPPINPQLLISSSGARPRPRPRLRSHHFMTHVASNCQLPRQQSAQKCRGEWSGNTQYQCLTFKGKKVRRMGRGFPGTMMNLN
jgi:hypothetical protein